VELSAPRRGRAVFAELEIAFCKHVEGTEQRENMDLLLRIYCLQKSPAEHLPDFLYTGI
jgi:hypothetical protein